MASTIFHSHQDPQRSATLRAVHNAYSAKQKQKEGDVRLVIVVKCAERPISELMVPDLPNWYEFTFASSFASPDPYFFETPPTKIWTQTLTLREPFQPRPNETCTCLSRVFNLSLPLALDVLYPHLQNTTNWAKANEPSPNLHNSPPTTTKNMVPSNKKDASEGESDTSDEDDEEGDTSDKEESGEDDEEEEEKLMFQQKE
ncbi:uncharacterized protein LACBIDRAFT_332711 [Laccaria bicolor S238N-H82]|uniref:Predicted protein n=1 Tax=Laccaria bicolor (strain S238N-H82 / ATCC MYA-4686) TaxID=486041 RepID=B0DTN1_LACBS|nr:uncharacterized protein LACBIDRAFT_332711 [Laccaria bicolor S238N-H82]EDR02087.1 predicted protein [Laccaria bicolor S238N-H82]|eukprot:XP_001887244.1 predicted protein [Laccaria bicolor S238N-H82]